MRRLALALLVALAPALAQAEQPIAFIAPTAPLTASDNRIVNTFWVNAYIGSALPLAAGSIWIGNGSNIAVPRTPSGDWTISQTGVATLASTITAGGPTGSATAAPIITYDAKGRLTAVSSATVTPAVTSITGLGTGIAAWLATPSSANLRAALTDETGTGAAYFQGGDLGTPSAGVLTNATGLPLTTGTTSVLPETKGGTNQSTYTTGDLLYASAANTLSKLADVATGNALISGGVTTAPSWGKITPSHISGVWPVANGGTNASSASGTALDNITGFSSTGLLVRTGSGTYAFRTLTGTAAEITVTNGDGVSGAPTLSLPSALTFTGKTITGGTYSSPTLTTPALGSPSSVGTMPAFTLGGTVSGGANQINNVVIGASNPLAGTFTTVAATSAISSAWNFDGSSSTITVANGSNAVLPAGAGLITLTDTSATGQSAVYLASGNAVVLVATTGTSWVTPTTTPAAGKFTVQWDGASAYRIYNNQGSSITFTGALLRSRSSN